MIIKNTLRVETVELVKMNEGDELIQGIVVEDRKGEEMIFWYGSPTTTTDTFGATIKRLLTEYTVKLMLGDFNARHPAWCTKHDEKRAHS